MSVNTLKPIIECELNPFLLADRKAPSYASVDQVKAVKIFHQSLPGYFTTPLVNLEELASRLGIDALMVKDESHRFDLKAFKVLGASYAIAREIKKRLGLNDEELNFDAITVSPYMGEDSISPFIENSSKGVFILCLTYMLHIVSGYTKQITGGIMLYLYIILHISVISYLFDDK